MRRRLTAIGVAILLFLTALSTAQTQSGLAGRPLAGLTPVEFEEFRLGLDDFLEVESAEEGLGPAFNGTSCAACHNVPAVGGGGVMAELRAGRRNADGEFETFDSTGETLFHLFSVPSHGCQPSSLRMPPCLRDAFRSRFRRRSSSKLFPTRRAELEDPNDRNGDGISGRAALVVDIATGERRVGRFGWKAQHATLLTFGADAYRNEMGITNDIFPQEGAFGITAEQMRVCDRIPDPEDIRDPRTRPEGCRQLRPRSCGSWPRSAARVSHDKVREGERVFAAIGCATCHVPSLETGPSENPLFDRKPVALFSDLLLHDVGTGDGIKQGAAAPNEIRTPALWGLRLRRPLLHDGSAATVDEAVRKHGGEAAWLPGVRARSATPSAPRCSRSCVVVARLFSSSSSRPEISPLLTFSCWVFRAPLAHELHRAGDSIEHLVVGVELVIGRHADHVEERAIVQQRRIERDALGAAGYLVLIR